MAKTRSYLLDAAIVGVVALLPRVWLLRYTADAKLFADMVDYYGRARHLVDHGQLYPDAFRVPLFPMAVAGWIALFGPELAGIRYLQTLILMLATMATYALAREITTRPRAIAAAMVVALYPGFLLYTVYLMAEPLYTLLMLLTILVSIRCPGKIGALLAGLLAGAATLVRQAGLLLIAVAFGAAVSHRDGRRWQERRVRAITGAALVLVGAMLAISPWLARNRIVFGRWMALETTGGITFLMANYEGATGIYHLQDWQTVHDRYLNKAPDEFSRNSMAYRIGLAKIAQEPARIIKLVPARLGYFFDAEGREHLWLYTSGYFGALPPAVVSTAGWLLLLAFPLLAIVAMLAFSFSTGPHCRAEVLVFAVVAGVVAQQTIIYGDPRFHLPLVPLLAVVAVRPWSLTRRPQSLVAAAVGLFSLLALLIWWSMRMPEQIQLLRQAAAPGGSQLALPY